jgi:hypothetical protein
VEAWRHRRRPPADTVARTFHGYHFLQEPQRIVLFSEWNHTYRIIPLDGRPHVGPNMEGPLAAPAAILDRMPIAYTLNIDVGGARIFDHSHAPVRL